jgi:hypothetical protein
MTAPQPQSASRRSMRATASLLLLASAMGLTGCATMDMPFIKPVAEDSRRNPVVQIVGLWQPGEGRDPEGMPCRGFAGQLIFLGNRKGIPVKVDGDVKVFVFDDQGTAEEQVKPLHEFAFDSGAWERHLQVGTVGPSYHLFVPYTRRGTHEANCTLRVRYTSEDGNEVYSDAVEITLKGKKGAGSDVPQVQILNSGNGGVMPASHSEGPRTTSIALPAAPGTAGDTTKAGQSAHIQRVLSEFVAEQAEKDWQQPELNAPQSSTQGQRIRWRSSTNASQAESTNPMFATAAASPTATRSNASTASSARHSGLAETAETATSPVGFSSSGRNSSLHDSRSGRPGTPSSGRLTAATPRSSGSARTAQRPPQNYLSDHPLANVDTEPAASATSSATAERRLQRRHPLSDELQFSQQASPHSTPVRHGASIDPELSDAPRWQRDAEPLRPSASRRAEADTTGQTSQVWRR